jgi:hypothetical protein
MAERGCDEVGALTHMREGGADERFEHGQGGAAHILEFVVLERAPDAFIGIAVGRVAVERLQAQLRGGAPGQVVLDHLAAVNRAAIPNDEELTGDLGMHCVQKVRVVDAIVPARPPPPILAHGVWPSDVTAGCRCG